MEEDRRYIGSPLFYFKLVFGLFTIALAVAPVLNARFYCISEGRTLSDAELLEAAMPRAFGLAQACIELRCVISQFETNYTAYEDLEDFTRRNPDCCEVLPQSVTQRRATDLDYLLGQARADIELRAIVGTRKTGDDVILSRRMTATNCGKLAY